MSSLRVIEIFDSLQGEGVWTGTPMTFVRLAGCNAPGLGLDCTRWCDTRDAWDPEAGSEWDIGKVLEQVRLPRLCLTGGEPLLQMESVAQLAAECEHRGILVHLETNGTLGPPTKAGGGAPPARGRAPGAQPGAGVAQQRAGRYFAWTTVSPKPCGYLVAPDWRGFIDELKLVVDEHLDAATAERLAAAHPEAVVSVQPCHAERLGRETAERAIALVMSHPHWRLSLQTQKLLGIR